MTGAEIKTMMDQVGIPTAYFAFDNDTAVPPPFLCFYFDDSDDLYADNTNYVRIRPLTIEMYTDTKDYALEERLESVLNDNGLTYRKTAETYISSERMLMYVYETEVIYNAEES